MKRITADWLISHEACASQVETFRDEWPDGAEVNLTNALRAVERGLDIKWLVRTLSPSAREAYDEAIATKSKAYDEAIATANKAYDEAIAPARNAYDEAIAPARNAYDEAIAPARNAYDEAIATANKAYSEAYDEAIATTLVAALRK